MHDVDDVELHQHVRLQLLRRVIAMTTDSVTALRAELGAIEAETFEVADYVEADQQLAGNCCSTSSTSTSSTSSCSATSCSSG